MVSRYYLILLFGDVKANETPIEEPETATKVLDIPSPCSMDIDSQTNNQLPLVSSKCTHCFFKFSSGISRTMFGNSQLLKPLV